MANINDVLISVRELPFSQQPFCETDAALMAQIVYLHFSAVLPDQNSMAVLPAVSASQRDIAADKPYEFLLRKRLESIRTMAESPRYLAGRIRFFTEELSKEDEKQFAALTYETDDFAVIAYRGTDLSLTGWKENFNMAISCPVPAQAAALDYLNLAARSIPKPLILTGHSKGANLACYSAAFCEDAVKDRIAALYTFDGPGLNDMDSWRLNMLGDKVRNYLPRGSVVGVLFHQYQPFTVVRSSAVGLMQHNMYTWDTGGARFQTEKALNLKSRLVDKTCDDWLKTQSVENRALFVETLYSLFTAANEDTLSGLVKGGLTSAKQILDATENLPRPVKQQLLSMIGDFISDGAKNIGQYALKTCRNAVDHALPPHRKAES